MKELFSSNVEHHYPTFNFSICKRMQDYDRDPEILKLLLVSKIWVLCAKLEFMSHEGYDENFFKLRLEELLKVKL